MIERGAILRERLRLRGALGIELLLRSIAGFCQRTIAFVVGVGASQCGIGARHLCLGNAQLRLRSGDRGLGGIGRLLLRFEHRLRIAHLRLRGLDAAGALVFLRVLLFARERDVLLRRTRLRLLRGNGRLRLFVLGTLVAVVEPDQDLALVHRFVRIGEDLAHAFGDLARDRHGIRIDARVVGRLVRRGIREETDPPNEDRDQHDSACNNSDDGRFAAR